MGNQKIMRRVLAGLLALLIGCSALGGIMLAFAATDDMDLSLPPPLEGGEEYYVPDDEDWEMVLPEEGATVHLNDRATLELPAGAADSLWLGWSEQYNDRIMDIGEKNNVLFDVVDFVFNSQLKQPAVMTIYTSHPYLYRLDNGKLTAVKTEYDDGAHRFSTDLLSCFLASDSEIAGIK